MGENNAGGRTKENLLEEEVLKNSGEKRGNGSTEGVKC